MKAVLLVAAFAVLAATAQYGLWIVPGSIFAGTLIALRDELVAREAAG